MNVFEILLISISLAMDAFAVSICKGMTIKKLEFKKINILGIYFGFFQMFMPFLGYFFVLSFADIVKNIDHWIAFILLGFIGINMIKESFSKKDDIDDKLDFKTMIILAIATSIDALAVGITYAFLEVTNIFLVFITIGIITYILSLIGAVIGNKFGNKFENKAELIGGCILIVIGIKILLEHLGVI